MGLVSLAMGYLTWRAGWENWQTMIFNTLTLSQMGHALTVPSCESLFKVGLFSNKALLGAVLLTFVFQMAVIYVPFVQNLFKAAPLFAGELLLSLVLEHGGILGRRARELVDAAGRVATALRTMPKWACGST
jgi:Ca2+-transporting ATPase